LQVSSIATLDGTGRWLGNLLDVLNSSSAAAAAAAAASPLPGSADNPTPSSNANANADANANATAKAKAKAKAHVLFPTADSVRRSLDGYASGASIHLKTQSAAQRKQVAYLRPLLRHWGGVSDATTLNLNDGSSGNDGADGSGVGDECRVGAAMREAGRRRAAPHIKTYIRFKDERMREVEWAMVTSANLSKQAWGEMENKDGNVTVASWEIGVVVWPALFADDRDEGTHCGRGKGDVKMVPVFKKDVPTAEDLEGVDVEGVREVVGFRMPYDLPLVPYGQGDEPWCATAAHTEPDWTGHAWGGYSSRA